MIRPLRIVLPFRPFEPESELHKSVADFDWLQALRMAVHAAKVSCHCDVVAITDVDTDLPVPALKYETRERRLMLWTLEVCAAYLESDDCDRDTVMLDVDQLVCANLAEVFDRKGAELGLVIRPGEKHAVENGGQPLLNGVQYWRGKSKKRIAEVFRRALATAKALPEDRITWGADTDALRMQVEPLELGITTRGRLRVQMLDSDAVIETFSSVHQDRIDQGAQPWPGRPVLDFRWTRKPAMPICYRAMFLEGAVA